MLIKFNTNYILLEAFLSYYFYESFRGSIKLEIYMEG